LYNVYTPAAGVPQETGKGFGGFAMTVTGLLMDFKTASVARICASSMNFVAKEMITIKSHN
jgi:hypothetical protein